MLTNALLLVFCAAPGPSVEPAALLSHPAVHAATDGAGRAAEILSKAKQSAADGDAASAVKSAKEAIELDPDLYEAHDLYIDQTRKATIKRTDGEYEATSKAATDALVNQYQAWEKRYPKSPGVQYGFGSVYYEQELPQAKPYLLKAVAANPKLAKVYEMLAIDACRWGDYPFNARYEKMAWDAEPSNFTFARHYALALKGRDHGQWKDLCRQVSEHFAGTDEGSQALGLIGTFSDDPKDKEAAYQEQLRKFPVDKYPSSREGLVGLASVYAVTDPAKAIDLYRQLAAMPKTGTRPGPNYQAEIDRAQAMVDATNQLGRSDYSGAYDRLSEIKLPRYADLSLQTRVELMKAQALTGEGKTEEAYQGLLARSVSSPTDELLAGLSTYGAKLGKTSTQVDADRWSAVEKDAKAAPGFDLYAYLQKRNVSLESLKGKTVFLSFWFPGCGPCRSEMVHLEPVMQRLKGKDFAYVGINVDVNQDPYVDSFLKTTKFSFEPLRDEGQKAMKAYGVRGCPTNFVIDPSGRIVNTGFMITDSARERMLELMLRFVKDHPGATAGG